MRKGSIQEDRSIHFHAAFVRPFLLIESSPSFMKQDALLHERVVVGVIKNRPFCL